MILEIWRYTYDAFVVHFRSYNPFSYTNSSKTHVTNLMQCKYSLYFVYLLKYSMMHFMMVIHIFMAESLTETFDKRKTMLHVKIIFLDI